MPGVCIRCCYPKTSERSCSRGYRTGSVLGGPTGSCSVTPGVWAQQLEKEGGAASWAWGAAWAQSSRGLLVPRVRWAAVDGQTHLGWARGPARKCHWNCRREEEERQEGAGGSQPTPRRWWWSFGNNSELGGRCQEVSFILLFLCKTWCQSLRHPQETSEPIAAVASSKWLRLCPCPHWGWSPSGHWGPQTSGNT